jgi:hypothetical protein
MSVFVRLLALHLSFELLGLRLLGETDEFLELSFVTCSPMIWSFVHPIFLSRTRLIGRGSNFRLTSTR